MSEETPGSAAGASSSVPPSGTSTGSSSGVAETPASSPGSTASPSPVSSPEPSSTSSGAASGEAFDFGAIFDAPAEIPPVSEPGVVAPPPTPKPPAEVPPVAPPAQPVEAPKPEPQAAQPGLTPATAPGPQADTLDAFDPASLGRHLAANEAAAVEFTAENMFKLTPSEVEALETNIVEAVPRLMARAFVKSQLNALEQMSRLVPAMIQKQTELLKRNSDNETKFYGRWPDIKQGQHGDLVRKYAAVYRQMHPNTTLEQMIEDLGPMVMMAARVVPQAAVSPSRAPTNGRGPPPPPFAPAGAGATNTSKAVELNPVEVMFQDHG